MVTISAQNGVTLSANATANGMPRLSRPFTVPRMGDYARRPEGRTRRQERRQRIADKQAYIAD